MVEPLVRRQLLNSALTLNALRPVPGYYTSVSAMAAGWLTSELAPHLMAGTAVDTLVHLPRGRRNGLGLALAAANLAGQAYLIRQAAAAKDDVEGALVEGLGEDYRERLGKVYTDLDLATPWQNLAMPFWMHDEEVEIIRDVRYAGPRTRGLLDIYRRRGSDQTDAPVLLQIHGGAWSVGDKRFQGVPLMLHMAARGWVCVAINYRLSPRHRWPAHLEDVKRAIAWVRENGASYGADPSYLAVTGGSAGGHLASLAALTPNRPEYQPGFEDADTSVQAAVPFYGVYDFAAAVPTRRNRQLRDRFFSPRVMGRPSAQAMDDLEAASPVLQVSADAPPFFVIHGVRDTVVPVAQAREMVGRLREMSKEPIAYAELPGAQHGFDIVPSIRSAHVVRGVDRFLRWNYARALERL